MLSNHPPVQRTATCLALIILLQLLTVIGFVLSKKILNLSGNYFSILLPFVNQSTILVPVMMGISFLLFFYKSVISTNKNKVIRKNPIYFLAISGLLFFSFFPLGNLIKHQTLFFEFWMWLCALWFQALLIVILSLQLWMSQQVSRKGILSSFLNTLFFSLTQKKMVFGDRIFFLFAIGWIVFFSWYLGKIVLGGIPHVQDSIAQLFQAKIFSMGKFALPVPHHAESFERIYTVMKDGRWYSIYPPGHAMLLAVGVILNIPQWVNPISSGCVVILSFIIAKQIYGIPVARFTLMFFMVSPFFVYLGAGWMNHPTALLFVMLFWFGLIRSNQRSGWRYGLILILCGLVYGMLFLTRPVTALAFLMFGIVWVMMNQEMNIKRLMFMVLSFAIGTVPLAAFYLYYNAHTTGSPFLTGYVDYFGGNPLGFGKQPWGAEPLGPKIPNEVQHTPLRGLANTICNINGLNYYLFGFPVPSLIFVMALFFPGMKRVKTDWLCILPLLLISFLYFFYFFQDYCYGPRFVYESIPFLCILSARGVFALIEWIQDHTSWRHDNIVSGMIGFVMICMVCSFSVVWVERYISMSQDYWSTRDDTLLLAYRSVPEEHALFFTELDEDFAALFSVMDPRLDRGWIVAHDLGEAKNQAVIESYPNVPVYSVHLQDHETYGFVTVIEPYTQSVIGP